MRLMSGLQGAAVSTEPFFFGELADRAYSLQEELSADDDVEMQDYEDD